MAKYKDKVVYPKTPDSYVGSENDGDSDDLSFTLKEKEPKDESNMPLVDEYPVNRYKEHR